jgi:hypothetical protein
MPMKHFACWEAQDAYTIINPDADALEDHIFRAVHTDFPVHVRSRGAGAVRVITSAEFLAALLEPKDHAIIPVVGQSGTGKSHLIRWLDLQLRSSTHAREVIYVPKAQTNLRDIVHSLVSRLPVGEQESYLSALSASGSASLSREAQRTAILNQIHLALVNDRGGSDSNLDPELENFALSGLRAMLTDPHIRKSLLVDNGFAAELAAHIFEKPEKYSPAEERREFRERDLPLQVGHLQKAALETQDFLRWLMGAAPSDRLVVIRIINRHLDWAIGNCLNLTGDRLIALMLDLRRHFRAMGRELVLLIEDFARLQGLDSALLQSIIEQRAELCVLRTVFASTRGFYDSIYETFRTRVTFLVDMDAPGEGGNNALYKFVSRYMNAVRWGPTALREQWVEVQSGEIDFWVPSKCDECVYKSDCHATFGAIEGMGLYPFTGQAVEAMAEKADARYQQSFNPRIFLRLVLRPVALAGETLRAGEFPPPQLLADLGGRTVPPAVLSRLQRDDPQQWQRRITFLELWGRTQEVKNLSLGLHTSFDLPVLRNAGSVADNRELAPRIQPPVGGAPVDDRVREVQEWQEERATLSSATAQVLRDLVFAALEEFIDWDNAGLAKAPFFGSRRGLFRAGQISFHNQATQPGIGPIRLQIPANWEDTQRRLRTTLALEGLLEAKLNGDWSFRNGLEKLASLLECLREWSQVLMDQIKTHDSSQVGGDIGGVAFELRATLQAALNTSLTVENDQEVLSAAFANLPSTTPDFLSAELADLIKALQSADLALADTVKTRFAATKGGAAGEFIDSARLLPIAKALRRRRFMPLERAGVTNPSAREPADPVRQAAKRVREGLAAALLKEASAREALNEQMTEVLGPRESREALLECVQRLINAAGFLSVAGTQTLLAVRARFEHIRFEDLVTALRSADSTKLDARHLRSGVGEAAAVLSDLIREVTTLLERTAAELTGRLAAAGVDPEERVRVTKELQTDLNNIGSLLGGYHDGNVN